MTFDVLCEFVYHIGGKNIFVVIWQKNKRPIKSYLYIYCVSNYTF